MATLDDLRTLGYSCLEEGDAVAVTGFGVALSLSLRFSEAAATQAAIDSLATGHADRRQGWKRQLQSDPAA